jgi:hypothetical protein
MRYEINTFDANIKTYINSASYTNDNKEVYCHLLTTSMGIGAVAFFTFLPGSVLDAVIPSKPLLCLTQASLYDRRGRLRARDGRNTFFDHTL